MCNLKVKAENIRIKEKLKIKTSELQEKKELCNKQYDRIIELMDEMECYQKAIRIISIILLLSLITNLAAVFFNLS